MASLRLRLDRGEDGRKAGEAEQRRPFGHDAASMPDRRRQRERSRAGDSFVLDDERAVSRGYQVGDTHRRSIGGSDGTRRAMTDMRHRKPITPLGTGACAAIRVA